MTQARDDPFQELVAALEPWLDQVVIVGGWAHRLYRLHPDAQALGYPPLGTLDTDIAVPHAIAVGEQDIRSRLLAHGFKEELLGDDRPPATHYRLGDEDSGFYAEFLTPLVGGLYDRKHRRKATTDVAGVSSQRLRHIELLLHQPWSVDLEYGKVRVANPVSFLAQKLLIHRTRKREDRAKDILYMHDTLEVFGARLPQLRDLWRNTVAPQLTPRSAKTVSNAWKTVFGEITDDIRRAADISAERALTGDALRQVCRHGLIEIFGE